MARGNDVIPVNVGDVLDGGYRVQSIGDTSMTFSGALTDVNLALDGLTFTPDASFTGTASVEILSNDLGCVDPQNPLTADDTVQVEVIASNGAVIAKPIGGAGERNPLCATAENRPPDVAT